MVVIGSEQLQCQSASYQIYAEYYFMINNQSSNIQIAKNTVVLYLRMIVTMIVNLYTSRLVLEALGISDYGLYNVVGGIVVMFGFLNGAMTGATQRYITFELGRGNIDTLKSVFRSSLQLHIIISILIILLAEPVGLWLMYNKMQIPVDRMIAAFWVFQLSIATFVTGIISVPYNASIIAHERMSIFAYVSITEVFLKLLFVYLLFISSDNRLVLYAFYAFIIQVGIRVYYGHYCKKHFEETNYKHKVDRRQLRGMLSFSGWNMFGNIAAVLNTQGLNLLLNMFFGPTVNASRGIAVQVQAIVSQFSGNFTTAINPGLTKSYAAGEHDNTITLMKRASRFSFFLLFMITLPLLAETEPILSLWLKEVPDNTAIFVRIILVCQLIWTYTMPMTTVAYATGKIKKVNTVCGSIVLVTLPISWGLLKMGEPAYTVFLVYTFFEFISMIVRMMILRSIVQFSIRNFIFDVFGRTLSVAIMSSIIVFNIRFLFPTSIISSLVICCISVMVVIIFALFVGIKKEERIYLLNILRSRISKTKI